MRFLPLLLAQPTCALTQATLDRHLASTNGFKQPTITESAGGHAICLSGITDITATATNTRINYKITDELNCTATNQDLLSPTANMYAATNGGPAVVSGTYAIASRLCMPADPAAAAKVQTIQVLTHGATLDSTYWDFAKDYSYLDAAAEAGYAVFTYDRLGTGNSSHPDPLQTVQSALQVEILHQIVSKLRSSSIANLSFKNVVGVAHSAGSAFTEAVTARYPDDFDAVVLTGITTSISTVAIAQAAFNLASASTHDPARFKGLANEYLTFGSGEKGIQFAFFKYPHFDPAIFTKQAQTIQTNTLGELLTLGTIFAPASQYTKPVYILNGANDFVFCGGDCSSPVDENAAALALLYPAVGAKGKAGQVPDAGHNVFLHHGAPAMFADVISFFRDNNL